MSDLSVIMDMLHRDKEDSDEKMELLFNNFRTELKADIALGHAEIKEETRHIISEMLPIEHDTDHDTIKMLRRWGTAFLGGLFGNMGRTIFFFIMMGVGIQIMNPKVAIPIIDTLIGAPK